MKISKSSIIVAAAVLIIIAGFAALLLISENGDRADYNGYQFVNENGLWQTEWEREGQIYVLDFRHHPAEVESIPITGQTDIRFQLEPVYITIDPSGEQPDQKYLALAAIDLARKLTEPFEREVQAACTRNETEACETRPIVTCENTNSTVIYLKSAEQTKIELLGNCAVIQGNGESIVMAAEKAIYQWLGIMD